MKMPTTTKPKLAKQARQRAASGEQRIAVPVYDFLAATPAWVREPAREE